jgi:Carboxypeptidase regulatory-like domain
VAGQKAEPTERRFGRVVDPDGAPVPNASIVIVAASVPMPEIALLSDGEGRFSLRLPAGSFTLRAHGPAGTGETEVEDPSTGDEIVIRIDR